MNKLRQLITEIHRRSIWQVLGVYVVGAWLGYEVVLSLTEGLGLPEWVPPAALILFIIGLPIVVATAMVQEGLPASGEASARGDRPPATGAEPEAPPRSAAEPGPHRFLTWKRSIAAGVLAFALLGLAAAGFLGMRAAGIGPAATLLSSGALEADRPVVLADFAGPPEVARVVTEAVRVDLSASPVVRIVPTDRVTDALRRMRREPDILLDRATARELAIREGLGAIITGEVAPLAASYVLTAEVVAADDGAVLASFRETARDSTELIDAIDALSASVRGKIGESLRSVRSGTPLAAYTTSSLEALRRYAEGAGLARSGGRSLETVAAYEDAVRLDPDFAMAWRKIGVEYRNLGVNPGRRDEALRRAYELADRLPDRERGLAIGTYHGQITANIDSALTAFRAVAERYGDEIAWNNMANLLNQRGDWEPAARAARKAIGKTQEPRHQANLLTALYGLARLDEFQTVLAEVQDSFPESPTTFITWVARPAADGEYAEALAWTDTIISRSGDDPLIRGRTLLMRAYILEIQGRVAEALEAYDEVEELGRRLGLRPEQLWVTTRAALALARVARDPAAARARLERGLMEIPLASL
ncbi:MAG: tetratricopeptide repeat protein, partial [Gemmatimonadetes bacterium]|nr:tetratricopeptide repeat protein [Gemmatimonadota bacterium]NIQ58338.1 tetratricopeptide repeat protein [Gemmatimonadota bacterium]NIU76476.1 tetratricopeptide repeat protein [Gammaproteobacteria bacterium]NIX47411.1 tetratricopeptide repeat protein [Gemmatimonadota bacterium]NIY11798.1 tetratricopeptide repeat protein [Gemmatimonadota bacterium]